MPRLKDFTLCILMHDPHYNEEANQVFLHFEDCCPQIETFTFDAARWNGCTGKSLSEALIFASTNPQL